MAEKISALRPQTNTIMSNGVPLHLYRANHKWQITRSKSGLVRPRD
jgi:hypothetical protein